MTSKVQVRPATRAPNGSPEFTEKISFYCTDKQKKFWKKNGRSQMMRDALTDYMNRHAQTKKDK